MIELVEIIRPVVVAYGALGVFLVSLAEEVIAPIPSTLTILAAGFFLIPASVSFLEGFRVAFFIVALPSAAGITLGSLLLYGIIWWGGKSLIDRFGRWFGVSWSDIEKIERQFEKGWADEAILFVLRATPLIPNSAISVFCGLIRYPLNKFIAITFLGTTLRALIMSLVGWGVGEAYIEYALRLEEVEKYIWLAIILFGLAIVFHFWKKRKSRNHSESTI